MKGKENKFIECGTLRRELAHLVKAIAAKPDDLGSVLGSYMIEGKNQLLLEVLWSERKEQAAKCIKSIVS